MTNKTKILTGLLLSLVLVTSMLAAPAAAGMSADETKTAELSEEGPTVKTLQDEEMTVVEAIANLVTQDGKVNFQELQKALLHWNNNKPVPGTGGKMVSFGDLQQIITLWQNQQRVNDRLAWEDGVSYDDPLEGISNEGGLSNAEIQKVTARAIARVEKITGEEFTRNVPVKIITREEYQNQGGSSTAKDWAMFDNVKYEALFMINESADSIAVQEANRGGSVLGYYSPSEDQIVVISDQGALRMDELTLGHELVHALQDQKFNIGQSKFWGSTREEDNAISGVIEGNANYVETIYEANCANWGGCLSYESESPPPANLGPLLWKLHPYSDGQWFTHKIAQSGGWDAVWASYNDLPRSTEQVTYPSKYIGPEKDEPSSVHIEDYSSDKWRILRGNGGQTNHAKIGEAGMATMGIYPFWHSGRRTMLLNVSHFVNKQNAPFDFYNYTMPLAGSPNTYPTKGWDGDKMYIYKDTEDHHYDHESYTEFGYVWKSKWDSVKDASEFMKMYMLLLKYHGAQPVEGKEGVWRIPEGSEFADTFRVTQHDSTVVITNAPTVDELEEIRPADKTIFSPASTQGFESLSLADADNVNIDLDKLLDDLEELNLHDE